MNKYILILKKSIILLVIFGVGMGGFYPLHQRNIDINEDGIIDVCDVQQLISAIISNSVSNLPDINNDGKIDIKDLQILMKNMGTKQKTVRLKTEIFSSIPRTNYDSQKTVRIWTCNLIKMKNYSLINENNKFTGYFKKFEKKRGEGENASSLRLYGEKYLAYHISAKSPPII